MSLIRRSYEVGSNDDGKTTIDGIEATTLVLEKGESYAFLQGGPCSDVVIDVGTIEDDVVYANGEKTSITIRYYSSLPETGAFEVDSATFRAAIEQGGYGYFVVDVPLVDSALVLYAVDVLDRAPVLVSTTEPIARIQTGDYVWVEMRVDERTSTNGGVDWTDWEGMDEMPGCIGTALCGRLILSVNLIPDESVSEDSLSTTD